MLLDFNGERWQRQTFSILSGAERMERIRKRPENESEMSEVAA